MPMVVTTISRQAVSASTKKPMSAEKPVAGIQRHRVIPAPVSPKPRLWVNAPNATSMAISHEATTTQMATRCDSRPICRPSSPVMTKPISGRIGMSGMRKVKRWILPDRLHVAEPVRRVQA